MRDSSAKAQKDCTLRPASNNYREPETHRDELFQVDAHEHWVFADISSESQDTDKVICPLHRKVVLLFLQSEIMQASNSTKTSSDAYPIKVF